MPLPALDCWILTGATAVGKTEVALALAKKLNAEIISLDSMAIYRQMNIGTAKPTPQQQALIPHHLIDIVDPSEEYSVMQFFEAAHRQIEEIRARNKEVLIVGGTPLYLKALIRGLFAGPPANWQLRNEIQAEIQELGSEALYERLQELDPIAAAAIHPNDTRRLIRAIEVLRATGQPISHQQTQFEEANDPEDCRVFVLRRQRPEQVARIEQRVDRMFAEGFIDEVRALTEQGPGLGRTASQAVGYREITQHLAGQLDLKLAIEQMKARTRRFAKRQATWFRSTRECRYLDLVGTIDTAAVVEEIYNQGKNFASA